MPDTNKAGRPRNATVRDLEAIMDRLGAMEAAPEMRLKAEFFGRIIAAAVGSMGSQAFSDMFLESLVNNAENVWGAYTQILTGEREEKLLLRVEAAERATRIANERAERMTKVAHEATAEVGMRVDPELTEGIEGDDLQAEDAPSEACVLESA